MSLMQDPKQIANWLIKRAGSSPAARPYIDTLRNAQGLLLTPGASGVDAVKVAADLKAQGETLRSGTPLESSAKNVGTAAPAVKSAAPVVKSAAKPAAPISAAAAAAAASEVVASLKKAAPANEAGVGAAPANEAGEGAASEAGEAPVEAAAEPAAAEPAAVEPAAAPAAAEPAAAPAAAPVAAPQGGRTRKTRHHTPKRKKLSRKKSIKRK